jgi:translation initiation factor 4E
MSKQNEKDGKDLPVVSPSVDLSVKHPLQNAWVLWFDNPQKRLGAKDWSQNLKKVLLLPCSVW